MKMPYNVFPDERRRGWVLIEMTGLSKRSSTFRIWPGALISSRKPIYFKTYKEAHDFACNPDTTKREKVWNQ
jgi:hypothetical protein